MRHKDAIDIGLIFYLSLIGVITFPNLQYPYTSTPRTPRLFVLGRAHTANKCMAPVQHGAFADPLRPLPQRLSKMLVSTPPILAMDRSSGDGFI